MSDSYSVLSEDTGTRDSVLPVCVTPQFEAAGPVFRNAEMWLYRERTVALLRRYLRISIEVGRLPSLLGRELFRSKVTSYRMTSFEDGVIFVPRRGTCARTSERIRPATGSDTRVPGLHPG